jgi:hypothetical protein
MDVFSVRSGQRLYNSEWLWLQEEWISVVWSEVESVQSKRVICEMLQQVVSRSNKFDHQIQTPSYKSRKPLEYVINPLNLCLSKGGTRI